MLYRNNLMPTGTFAEGHIQQNIKRISVTRRAFQSQGAHFSHEQLVTCVQQQVVICVQQQVALGVNFDIILAFHR
jgi:hypothetical protein